MDTTCNWQATLGAARFTAVRGGAVLAGTYARKPFIFNREASYYLDIAPQPHVFCVSCGITYGGGVWQVQPSDGAVSQVAAPHPWRSR